MLLCQCLGLARTRNASRIVWQFDRMLSKYAETSAVLRQRNKNVEEIKSTGQIERNKLKAAKLMGENELNVMATNLNMFVSKIFRFWVFNWMLCLYCCCGFILIAVNHITNE